MVKLLDFWAEWCIDPQTPVLTEKGKSSAVKIKVGQKLVTIDPQTYQQAIKTVQKVRIIKNAPSKKITLETGRYLIGDKNHLVLTPTGFKSLKSLELEEAVLIYKGEHRNLFPIKHTTQTQVILEPLPQFDKQLVLQKIQFSNDDFVKDILWEKVIEIENTGIRDVIGITVEAPHTIVTNGIVSHNCGPCKFMEPIMDELEKELAGKVKIEKINVDEKPDEAAKYGVMSIPTYIVLKEDKEVERIIGATSKDNLLKAITKHE